MKKILLTLSVIAFSFMATTQVVHAKKFGGGGSFGFSKKMPPKQFNQNKQKQDKAAQPAGKTAGAAGAAGGAAASGASRWLGPLAGLAAGGLLAAMIFGDGFEGLQMFDILLFALIAFILFQLFKRRSSAHAPLPQQSQYEQSEAQQQRQAQMRETMEKEVYTPNTSGSIFGSALGTVANEENHVDTAPEWFDADNFIDGAKGHFVSVQKAWDALDLSEIQAYCTPELYDALQGEIAQIQQGENVTIVEDLDAEIADMTIEGDYFIVSVRFTGFIKEEQFGDAHAFNEIWHIRRLATNEGDWQIAGIQQ